MNEYNERWTREKFLNYRILKRGGYTHQMLIEHFGEDIYHSGLYNRNSTIMPWLQFLEEIVITPEETNYDYSKEPSDIYPNKFDHIIKFRDGKNKYVAVLFYYVIDEIETYNILFTTQNQWRDYKSKLGAFRNKGYITDSERHELVNIVERETGFDKLYSVMKKVSYVLFDFIGNKLDGNITISIGETKNLVKINLYRNIIKNSFPNVRELGEKFDEVGNKYYIYEIND